MAMRLQPLTDSYYNAFLGPTACWAEEEGDEFVVSHLLTQAKDALSRRLKDRAASVLCEEATPDDLLKEIRLQLAEAGVTGDLTRVKDLADLAMDIVCAVQHSRDRL